MKYLSYAWTILLNLVAVGVVILIFSRDLQSFERIAISVLVMIYLNSISGTAVAVQQVGGILTLAKLLHRKGNLIAITTTTTGSVGGHVGQWDDVSCSN